MRQGWDVLSVEREDLVTATHNLVFLLEEAGIKQARERVFRPQRIYSKSDNKALLTHMHIDS